MVTHPNTLIREHKMLRTTRLIPLFSALFFLSGCASILYNHPGRVEMNSNTTPAWLAEAHPYKITKPLPQQSPGASSADFRTVLYEMTPLGFFGPLFNYPEVIKGISGNLRLKYSKDLNPNSVTVISDPCCDVSFTTQTVRDGVIAFDCKPIKGTHSFTLQFNKNNYSELKEYGSTMKIAPDHIVINIICSNKACAAEANPPVISHDGLVQIKKEKVTDIARLQEIVEEQKHKIAEQYRHNIEEIELQKKAAEFQKLGIDINCTKRSLADNLMAQSQARLAYGDNNHELFPFTTRCLYEIGLMTPVQKLSNGYLLTPNPTMGYHYQYSMPAFVLVYTNDDWDENQSLQQYPYPVRYYGEYKYTGVNGFEQTVPAFKVWKNELP